VKSVIRPLLPRLPSLLLKIKLAHKIYKNRAAREGARAGTIGKSLTTLISLQTCSLQ
jgi:hypothetical protein